MILRQSLVRVLFGSVWLLMLFVSPTQVDGIMSYLPKFKTKKLEMNMKVLLNEAKLRKVPLMKATAEKRLVELYERRKEVMANIGELEMKLANVIDGRTATIMRTVEVKVADERPAEGSSVAKAPEPLPKMRLEDITSGRVTEWKGELTTLQRDHQFVQTQIDRARSIVENPDRFVRIPVNYGDIMAEKVREAEFEILVRDRDNMIYRAEDHEWLHETW